MAGWKALIDRLMGGGDSRPALIREKRESLYLMLFPFIEAFALPSIVERAIQRPTPYEDILTAHAVGEYAHTEDIYHCFILDYTLKVAKFQ